MLWEEWCNQLSQMVIHPIQDIIQEIFCSSREGGTASPGNIIAVPHEQPKSRNLTLFSSSKSNQEFYHLFHIFLALYRILSL